MAATAKSTRWLKALGWLWFIVFGLIGLDAITGGVITTGGRRGPYTFYGPNAALIGTALIVVACWPGLLLLRLGERRAILAAAASAIVMVILVVLAREL